MKPVVRKYTPPSEEELATIKANVDKFRVDLRKRQKKEKPYNRELLALSSIPLRSPQKALECTCSCHPRVNLGLHKGGTQCPCQQTPAERKRLAQKLFADLNRIGEPLQEYSTEQSQLLQQKAQELNVKADIACQMAPFVIVGEVDGRAFYLRERHDKYRVTIASDDHPTTNPWNAPPEEPQIDIQYGDISEFQNVGEALEIAVRAVRQYQQQQQCPHLIEPNYLYCPLCGIALPPDLD